MTQLIKKSVRTIKVDLDKCNGCRACEIACAAFHAIPKYSSFNPARSRIRVVIDERNDEWVAIRATDYSKAGCDGRRTYTIKGKEYSECSFCGTVCPTRDLFKEPDSGLPMKCDMCEDEPEPLCVQACPRDCLTCVETEELAEEDTEEIKPGEAEIGIQSLIDRFGSKKVEEILARMTQKG
ncbi:MAG: (4Fe-4S)-binding protein [Thermincola sp.]|jgi:Fe-S-cluster-containing dehydrogenase component|nr:(4Fe-4S)-binding protein [Thermincola sp.]MDT3704621.1 (4Fe-4S)-binding protein [Thermincola sp.]